MIKVDYLSASMWEALDYLATNKNVNVPRCAIHGRTVKALVRRGLISEYTVADELCIRITTKGTEALTIGY